MIAASLALAAPALGQEEPSEAPVRIAELIDLLDARSLEAREEAMARLSERTAELSRSVGESIRPAELTAEERARLEAVLKQRFFLTPRAGLGVSFRAEVQGGVSVGVLVAQVVPGFPVAEVLEAGDVIIEAEGQPLANVPGMQADAGLRYAILSLDPGESINLVVMRGAERLEFTVPTGSFENLRNAAGQPNARLLEGAWRVRAQRLGLMEPEAIGATDADPWPGARRARGDVPSISPAGRPGAEHAAERAMPALASPENDARTTARLRLGAQAALREIDNRIEESQERLREARVELRRAARDPDESRRLQSEIQRLQLQISSDVRRQKELLSRINQLSQPLRP